MTALVLQPNDPRIGSLTSEGQYHWPSVDSAGNAYMVPNDNIHWLDASHRVDGTRRFVVVADSDRDKMIGVVNDVGMLERLSFDTPLSRHVDAVVMGTEEPNVSTATDKEYYDASVELLENAKEQASKAKHKSKKG